MPELPEVETIRRSLEPLCVGRRCLKLLTFTPEVLEELGGAELSGQKLLSLGRKGKYLLFRFEASDLICHLRMTGRLIFDGESPEKSINPYTRALLLFEGGCGLRFDDVRRFGRLKLCPRGETWRDKGFAALGPDAISEAFTPQAFIEAVRRHPAAPIKAVLLNQTVVAGVGNIYADESLFRAGIRPDRRAGRISEARLTNLQQLLKAILVEAIGLGGTSFRDYVNALGRKGHFQLKLAVYQKEGQACPNCGQTLKKCFVAGRGTRYCAHCQH